jgi:glutaredoxin-like protein NrdH
MAVHVPGKNVGRIVLHALSTCIWCQKTKLLLRNLGVEHSYIDVDLLEGAERAAAMEVVRRCNPQSSFPTLVINEDRCIAGFKEDEIRMALTP